MATGSKIHGDYRVQIVHSRWTDGRLVLVEFTIAKGAEVDARDEKGDAVRVWQTSKAVTAAEVEAQIACKAVEYPSGGKAVQLTGKELGEELKEGDDAALYEAVKAHLDREQFASKMAAAEAVK